MGVVGKVQKKEEGRVEKKMQHARGGRGSNLGSTTCKVRVPSCTLWELFRQASLSVTIDRIGDCATSHAACFGDSLHL